MHPVVDRAAGAFDSGTTTDGEIANRLDSLLRSGKVRLPAGDSDEEIAELLFQELELE